MDNNKAFVAYLENVKSIPNADKIVSADVVLNKVKLTQIVTGKGTLDHTLVVYFDSNLCINEKVIADYPDIGTYLAKGGRIRVIKLKGVISNGLTIEPSKFYKYFKSKEEAEKTLKEGYSFDTIGDQPICKKYLPPATQQPAGAKKGRPAKAESRVLGKFFHFHFDTDQLLRNAHKIKPEDIISISRKIHGTSAIVSHVPCKRKLTFVDRLAKLIGAKIQETEYDYLYASRTVIKNARRENDPNKKHFYKVDLWSQVGKDQFYGKLNEGETVYYEIVGYIPGSSSPIQRIKGCDYNYGCNTGEYKIAVYRITLTGGNGCTVEYSWDKLKERCAELGVPMVQEFYYGRAMDFCPEADLSLHWHQHFLGKLQDQFLNKKATDCQGCPPDEGIVLRVEKPSIECYKMKDVLFLLEESGAKDKDEVVDVDEQEQVLERGLLDVTQGKVSKIDLKTI